MITWPIPRQIKRLLLAALSTLLLIGAAVSGSQLIGDLRALQQLQLQRAELSDVKYGLLNAEVWVDQIATILAERIEGFELNPTNRPQLKRQVELVLHRLLQEIDSALRRRNAEGETWLDRLQGSLRQGVQDWLVDFDNLRARVPLYADAVLDELNQPETKAEIKQGLLRAIDEAATATFSRVDRSALTRLQADLGCETLAACKRRITLNAKAREARSKRLALWTLGMISLLFALHLPRWQQPPPTAPGQAHHEPSHTAVLLPETMLLLSAGTLILLAAGVMTPMIEVEARIDQLSLTLLGKPILFRDQVLYFQSKSILDVVQVLLATGAVDMILVALLILLFSLVFPAAKVIAGLLYYDDLNGLRRHAVVQFFALRSGKWSMADVLVIAILMAYLGFDGLIASQLTGLGGASERVDLISTNGTSLQVGFFMFLAFVLASLLLSTLLESRAPRSNRSR